MKKKSTTAEVTILVGESHRKKLPQVQAALRAAGMKNLACQEAIGTFTGAVDQDGLPRVKSVPGVAEVEVVHKVQLPPPDADVQ